jgi:uncharacterized protein
MYYYHYPFFRQMPALPFKKVVNKLKVTGEGAVSVQPNQAVVTLGAVTEDKDLAVAQSTNAQKMNKVIQALKNAGLKDEQIQTIEYRVDLMYDFKNGEQVFRGYQVTNILRVTMDDIQRIGQMVDIAVQNGANTVRNFNFSVKDKESSYNQALMKAIQNGRQKAAVIGQELGVNIEHIPFKVTEIIERPEISPREMVLGVSTDSAFTPTPIVPGTLEIRAVVDMEFEY